MRGGACRGCGMRGIPFAVLMSISAVTSTANAALHAGEPFSLAETVATGAHQIAGNDQGYLLLWPTGSQLRARQFGPDARGVSAGVILATGESTDGAAVRYGIGRVVANEVDFLFRYSKDLYKSASSGGPLEWIESSSVVNTWGLSSGGVPPGLNGETPGRDYGRSVIGEAGKGFAVVEASFHPTPSGGVGAVWLALGGSAQGDSSVLPLSLDGLTNPVGVVSTGVNTLVALKSQGATTPSFLVTVTNQADAVYPPGALTMTGNVMLVRHDSTFYVVWDGSGQVRVDRLDAAGRPLADTPLVVGGGDGQTETLVDVEASKDALLVLSSIRGDGGSTLHVRRVGFDGVLVDSEWLDVPGMQGDLAPTPGGQWLLATQEDDRIVGRYIGEGTLPPPPKPAVADGGASPDEPDSSAPTDGSGGAPAAGTGGTTPTGGTAPTGGSSSAGATVSTGGKASSAASGGAPARDDGAAKDDSGCSVRRGSGASSVAALAVALGALFTRRRRVDSRSGAGPSH